MINSSFYSKLMFPDHAACIIIQCKYLLLFKSNWAFSVPRSERSGKATADRTIEKKIKGVKKPATCSAKFAATDGTE